MKDKETKEICKHGFSYGSPGSYCDCKPPVSNKLPNKEEEKVTLEELRDLDFTESMDYISSKYDKVSPSDKTWEEEVKEILSRYNAEVLNKFQDEYLMTKGPGCEEILFPVLEKAINDFVNPPNDGQIRKFSLKDAIESLLTSATIKAKESVFEKLISSLPSDAENLSTLTEDQALRLIRTFLDKRPFDLEEPNE